MNTSPPTLLRTAAALTDRATGPLRRTGRLLRHASRTLVAARAMSDPRYADIQRRRHNTDDGNLIFLSDDLDWGDFCYENRTEHAAATAITRTLDVAANLLDNQWLYSALDNAADNAERRQRGWSHIDAVNLNTWIALSLAATLDIISDHSDDLHRATTLDHVAYRLRLLTTADDDYPVTDDPLLNPTAYQAGYAGLRWLFANIDTLSDEPALTAWAAIASDAFTYFANINDGWPPAVTDTHEQWTALLREAADGLTCWAAGDREAAWHVTGFIAAVWPHLWA